MSPGLRMRPQPRFREKRAHVFHFLKSPVVRDNSPTSCHSAVEYSSLCHWDSAHGASVCWRPCDCIIGLVSLASWLFHVPLTRNVIGILCPSVSDFEADWQNTCYYQNVQSKCRVNATFSFGNSERRSMAMQRQFAGKEDINGGKREHVLMKFWILRVGLPVKKVLNFSNLKNLKAAKKTVNLCSQVAKVTLWPHNSAHR